MPLVHSFGFLIIRPLVQRQGAGLVEAEVSNLSRGNRVMCSLMSQGCTAE